MVWSDGKSGIHCGATVRRTTASVSFRKNPIETITFSGEVPSTWPDQIRAGIRYSLGKRRRWEILEEDKRVEDEDCSLGPSDGDDYVIVTVVHKLVHGKTILKDAPFGARVEAFTLKDALRRPRRWPQKSCHRSRGDERHSRPKRRSTRDCEFDDAKKCLEESQWYKDWSVDSWEEEPHAIERHVPRQKPSMSCTRRPRNKKTSNQDQIRYNINESLCNTMSWKTDVILPSDLKTLHKQQQEIIVVKQGIETNSSLPSHCVVCFERETVLYDAGCGHGMCLECWGLHARSKIEEGRGELTCPVPNCGSHAPDEILKCMLSREEWKQLVALRNDALVSSHPLLSYCPDPHCRRVLQRRTEDVAVIQCPCGGAWCPQCRGPSHWPAPCRDRRWWDTNQGKLVSAQPSEIKTCPACFVEIEKNGGCNHMHCRACKAHFCWQCGAHGDTPSYHRTGVPCEPTKWWLVTLSVEASAEYIVPDLLAQDQLIRDSRTRLHNHSSAGYAPGLSIHAIIHHERNISEAQHLVFHILLARHFDQHSVWCGRKISNWLREAQAYTRRLQQVLTDRTRAGRTIMKQVRAQFGRNSNRFAFRVSQLRECLSNS